MLALKQFQEHLKSEIIKNVGDISEISIHEISYNSKDVKPGTLFFCKGNAFRKEYLEEAIQKGAVAYVSEVDYGVSIPGMLVTSMRRVLAPAASLFYDHPEAKLRLVGITGTKGKSTTCVYLHTIYDAWARKYHYAPSGMISSIYNFDGAEREDSSLSTPEPFELFSFLNRCVYNGVDTVIMEVSSQALKYGRTSGLYFQYCAFLNISEDHISPIEHSDFADYFRSKLRIFSQSHVAILNMGSDHFSEIEEEAAKSSKRVYVGKRGSSGKPDYILNSVEEDARGLTISLSDQECTQTVWIPTHGSFNAENALVADAIAMEMGIDRDSIREGLSNAFVPGRMEVYFSFDERLFIYVDYAHNRLSFETLLQSVREMHPNAGVLLVFGSAGGKALNRRQDLGEVAGKYADYCVLTAEDPNYEPVQEINQDIGQYLDFMHCPWVSIEDREEALRESIRIGREHLSEKNPLILLFLGKGAENTQKIRGNYEFYLSDSRIAQEMVDDWNKNYSSASPGK